MTDCRKEIYEALKSVCDTVYMGYPERDVVLPMITYYEVVNVKDSKWIDSVDVQLDVYANSFEACIDLMQAADAVMCGMHFDRTYTSPDSLAKEGKDLYHKALNYRAKVDTYHGNIIHNFY